MYLVTGTCTAGGTVGCARQVIVHHVRHHSVDYVGCWMITLVLCAIALPLQAHRGKANLAGWVREAAASSRSRWRPEAR